MRRRVRHALDSLMARPVDRGRQGLIRVGSGRSPMPASDTRIRRSASDRMLLGVCGGIAEHTDIDPVYIRLAFLVSLFWGGIGFLAYVAAALVMPKPLT